MPYEQEIEQLAKGALGAHGPLTEVVFLEANKDSLLLFSDGTVIPVLHQQHGYDIRSEAYALQLAREHKGTDYFALLAFGYSGTGPSCYAIFLRTAGFSNYRVEEISAPLKLKADGTKVKGIDRGGTIEWEDRSETPSHGGRKTQQSTSQSNLAQMETSSREVEASAGTLEEARAQIRKWTSAGQSVLSEKIVSDGKEKRLEAFAETTDEAYMTAEEQLPKQATIIGRKEIKAPYKKSFTVSAEDETAAKINAARQIGKTDMILDLRLLDPGRRGFLGIGRRPKQFQVQVLEQAVVEVKYKSTAQVIATVGFPNRGDLHDTLSKASSYWMARISSPRKDPFIMYTFDKEESARNALRELPCIHDAEGGLICTEVLIFGWYRRDDGIWEAVICGDDLTVELWDQAKSSFEKHGGKRKNDLKPTKHSRPTAAADHGPDDVVFIREDRTENPRSVYRVHHGPDAASAKAFLDLHPVTQPLFYMVVETPEGTFGRDQNGYYKE